MPSLPMHTYYLTKDKHQNLYPFPPPKIKRNFTWKSPNPYQSLKIDGKGSEWTKEEEEEEEEEVGDRCCTCSSRWRSRRRRWRCTYLRWGAWTCSWRRWRRCGRNRALTPSEYIRASATLALASSIVCSSITPPEFLLHLRFSRYWICE